MRRDSEYVDVAGEALGLRRKRIRPRGNRRVALVFVIPLLAGIGAIAFLALSHPQPPPPLSLQDVKRSEQHIQTLKQTLTDVKEDARAHRSHPFAISLTQDDVNTLLTTDADVLGALSRHGVRNVFAWVRDGAVQATAELPVSGIPVSVTSTLKPQVVDGGVVFEVQRVSVGRLGIPGDAAEQAAARLAAALGRRLNDPGIRYTGARVVDSAVIVNGTTR